MYQLVLDRKVGEYELPEGASLIACGTRHNAEAIADFLPGLRPSVVLMNPPFSATPGVDRIRHDADLRHLRSAFSMLPPGGRLPDARIAYVSATGATTIPGLAYAGRLGLWAAGETPFETRTEFVSAMEAGGVAALEVVARDLKALGLYQARALSYDGVEVEIVPLRGKAALVSSSSYPSSSTKDTFTFTRLPASAATSS